MLLALKAMDIHIQHDWHLTCNHAKRCVIGARREQEIYGGHIDIYVRLRGTEEDEQSLGFGKGYAFGHCVHAMGLGNGETRRYYGSLWRRVCGGAT
jgi:hypothetical protein